MKRETTNIIRALLEDWLPPVLRDSGAMRALFKAYWGSLIDDLEDFRKRGHHYTEKEYIKLYAGFPRIQSETDNSTRCLERIAKDLIPGSVLDVGCGTGYLVRYLHGHVGHAEFSFTGIDIDVADARETAPAGVEFVAGKAEQLPFPDKAFDVVVCTHLLEHILDIRQAVAELRRVCKKRLIIVVPREREHAFTFNPHLHFFPYKHSFLRQIIPVPKNAICEEIGRDFYYLEELS